MNKTKNIQNKSKKLFITASIAIVVALALLASPIVAMDDAFATKKKKGHTATQSYLNHNLQSKTLYVLLVQLPSYHAIM